MWAFLDGYNRNGELWAVVLTVPGRVSVESNHEGWSYGVHSSFHGCPSELVFLDLEGLSNPFIVLQRTIIDEGVDRLVIRPLPILLKHLFGPTNLVYRMDGSLRTHE